LVSTGAEKKSKYVCLSEILLGLAGGVFLAKVMVGLSEVEHLNAMILGAVAAAVILPTSVWFFADGVDRINYSNS